MMNKDEFRIIHSMVIEHYQFIERELEGIYAALSGKHFYMGLKDVETFSINIHKEGPLVDWVKTITLSP